MHIQNSHTKHHNINTEGCLFDNVQGLDPFIKDNLN